jgi:hypothetical protein
VIPRKMILTKLWPITIMVMELTHRPYISMWRKWQHLFHPTFKLMFNSHPTSHPKEPDTHHDD